MQPEPYDSGNEAQVKAKKTKAQFLQERLDADTREAMATPGLRRRMWRTLSDLGVYTDTGHTDPLMVGRFLGARSKGLMLLAELIRVCPDEYGLMQAEATKQEKEDKAHE